MIADIAVNLLLLMIITVIMYFVGYVLYSFIRYSTIQGMGLWSVKLILLAVGLFLITLVIAMIYPVVDIYRGRHMIRLDKITKIYDAKVENKKVLDEVSLTIDNGEFVAIMGPSGSGKSTLLNIIGCMDSVTDGSYYVDDIEVSRLNKSDIHRFRKKNIGFVFQHFALMDYYTAYENIELPLLANNIRRKDRKRIINEQLKKLNIVEEKDKLPKKMSGGQQQRVAIARALVTNADIILADEPTGALDQSTGQEVINILREINNQGKTVVLVTHDINIASNTNRIINICDGKIISDEMV